MRVSALIRPKSDPSFGLAHPPSVSPQFSLFDLVRMGACECRELVIGGCSFQQIKTCEDLESCQTYWLFPESIGIENIPRPMQFQVQREMILRKL
jgi:hypothetical protein